MLPTPAITTYKFSFVPAQTEHRRNIIGLTCNEKKEVGKTDTHTHTQSHIRLCNKMGTVCGEEARRTHLQVDLVDRQVGKVGRVGRWEGVNVEWQSPP